MTFMNQTLVLIEALPPPADISELELRMPKSRLESDRDEE